jgi:MFS family permease
MAGFAMYAMNLIGPQIMQLSQETGYGLGQSMVQMGLWIAPMGLGMMAVSGLGARITRLRGARTTLVLAGIVIAIGYAVTALVLGTIGDRGAGPADHGTIVMTLVLVAIGTTVVGCGTGFAFGAMPTLIMGAVPAGEKAAANGLNALMRSTGMSISSAVIGAVLAGFTTTLEGVSVPSRSGFLVALLIGCGGALVASAIAAAIPQRTGAGQASAGHEAHTD